MNFIVIGDGPAFLDKRAWVSYCVLGAYDTRAEADQRIEELTKNFDEENFRIWSRDGMNEEWEVHW